MLLAQMDKPKAEITIFSISNIMYEHLSKSVVGAQWLAIQEINNNSDFFPYYKLKLKLFDAQIDVHHAIKHALNITMHENSMNETYFPIILGAPWSSLSISIAPVLNAFNIGQISSSSTSIVLSDDNKYPYFYRTVPSDSLQSQGLILLCNTFNWTKIAVVYVNDVYGLYLSLEIQELGKNYDIDVTSIAISEYEDLTYNYAAKQIKDLNIFIIIIIIHTSDIKPLFTAFKNEGINGYPYLYLGTDGWFDDTVIDTFNLSVAAAGSIGTVPWQTQSLSLDEYDNDIQSIINQSINRRSNLLKTWQKRYHDGDEKHLNVEKPGSYMSYGYDTMFTLAYAIKEIEDNQELYGGNLVELIQNEDINSKIINILNNIIVNKTDFIGTTGHVMFDEVGDRIKGLYSFANILNDGTLDYFGYFYLNENGKIISRLNVSKIIWPKYFTEKDILPRSDILIHEELTSIPTSISITTCILSVLSMLMAIFCIILSIYYRKYPIIRAASWRLNIIICFGAILIYIRSMTYGIDEVLLMDYANQQYILDIVCNLRTWIVTIAYTLLFMPLFAKTYRLSQIFNGMLTKKNISDKKLFILIGICVIIDIISLTILTFINPSKRLYLLGNIEKIDEIQQIQYKYGSCSNDVWYFWHLYGVIIFWKICQSFWGVHVALSVSRIHSVSDGISNQLIKFDETGIQLFSILFTFIVIVIAIPMFVFGMLTKNILIPYLIVIITILLIGNAIICINVCPRIYAVMSGNGKRFKKSPAEQMEENMKKQLYRLGWVKSQLKVTKMNELTEINNNKSHNKISVHVEQAQENSTDPDENTTMAKVWGTQIAALHVK